MKQINNKLIPDENKHLKDIGSGEICEGAIYLGIYDSVENYTEVSEEEYQAYLNREVKDEYFTDVEPKLGEK
jgi:hypothetical protein